MAQKKDALYNLLGQTVTVQVDRPVGYNHHGILYPVNYGFLPGLMAGDGEEQDAYILGISEPVESFRGRVIAVIRRHTDCEDKLVVAPEGILFHQGEIARMVHFQEQSFPGSMDCLLRKSCGIIPCRTGQKGTEFLILLQTNNCWSFPKGHMEPDESEEKAALRELKEETGLAAKLIPGIRLVSRYRISEKTEKELVLFPGWVSGQIRPDPGEIRGYRWVAGEELGRYLQPDTYAVCREAIELLK